MCGCGRKNVNAAKTRSSTPVPSVGLSLTQNLTTPPKVQSNNVTPMMGITLPTPTGVGDADRRRIQKLRQEAIQKSLGKFA